MLKERNIQKILNSIEVKDTIEGEKKKKQPQKSEHKGKQKIGREKYKKTGELIQHSENGVLKMTEGRKPLRVI